MQNNANWHTADLLDAHPELHVVEPLFRDFGGRLRFAGPIRTVELFEDNSKVRAELETPGEGAVLVVDGGGSHRVALLGDKLGDLAVANGWSGLVIHGCVRDTAALAKLDLGIRALAAMPRKSEKRDVGNVGGPVTFGRVRFEPGAWLYADQDGIVVSAEQLPLD